ncbi:MAG: hypothetical protein ACTMUB_07570 [cyanobacterium endosymbiont of Rhopalodia musculus]|nr:hypothetical protein [cyanobacterium endosymbiont of Epithemia clementina EcSB]WGT67947.1 hypothetical protein P3F56_02370 [cyanobacterium endosymbiont of Epithemia clementina EcSB]
MTETRQSQIVASKGLAANALILLNLAKYCCDLREDVIPCLKGYL